jgi:hypothetical protein
MLKKLLEMHNEVCAKCGSKRNHEVNWVNPHYTICEDCGYTW